ncbi:MAG: biotin/lipoyl-binding protein [Pirellulales bacterium]
MNPAGGMRLIPGLKFTPHVQGRNRWYAVEDPQSGRFLKLGYVEYLVVSCLQNGLGPADICKSLELHDVPAADAQEHVAMTVSWLVRNGLLINDAAPPAGVPGADGDKAKKGPAQFSGLSALDPFFIKMPLLSGSFTERIARPLCILLSRWAAVIFGVLVVAALVSFAGNADKLMGAGEKLFVEDGRLWWVAAWLLLKAVHELGHAVAALSVGSRIRSAGLHLIYMGPVPYIDVTDMWTIATRRHRVLVSACGMLFESAVAAAAVITASLTDYAPLQYFCAALATLGTVTTFAFNANPLMRFDGYYIVSDWMSRPNLWTEAQTAVNDLFARIVNPFAPREGKVKWGLAAYGIACSISRMLVMITLAWWLLAVWDGIGILIGLWAVYCWFYRPWAMRKSRAQKPAAAPAAAAGMSGLPSGIPPELAAQLAAAAQAQASSPATRPGVTPLEPRSVETAMTGTTVPEAAAVPDAAPAVSLTPEQLAEFMAAVNQRNESRTPPTAVPGTLAGPATTASAKKPAESSSLWTKPAAKFAYMGCMVALLIGIGLMPSPWGLRAPGVIGYANPTVVRSMTEGFLVELPVIDGQPVLKGQLIARLSNPELENELKLTRLKLETSQEQISGFRARGELALLQAEQAKLESLSEHLTQLETRAASLEMTASEPGTVMLAAADKVLGRFVQAGQPLCMVVNRSALEVRALADQRDAPAFLEGHGRYVFVRGTTGRSDRAQLVSIDRRGSDICPEPSLAANYGGPLTVAVGKDRNGQPELKFEQSRFDLVAELSPEACAHWVPGQLVSVSLDGKPQRLWQSLLEAALDLIEQRAAVE